MSQKDFYAERNAARKDRTLSRRQARMNKSATVRAFTPAAARAAKGN